MTTSILLGPIGLGGPELIIIGVVFLIALLPLIFYLMTLQRTLELVSPDLRQVPPGQVWLLVIPIFGIIWHFILIGKIADSLAAEFRRRNIPLQEARPAFKIGQAMCILQLCGIIPVLGGLAGLAGFICFIIYWVKIAGYKRELERSPVYYPMGMPQQNYPPNYFNQQQTGNYNQQNYPPNYNNPPQNQPPQGPDPGPQ